MAKKEYIGVQTANTGAYQRKQPWYANKNEGWESLIINKGYRFFPELKKLIPPASIKAFFLPKCVKKVVISLPILLLISVN